MKLLAFDTSTETLSIAVCRPAPEGAQQVWHFSGAGGAQASSTLIPSILALLAQAEVKLQDLVAIVFGAGPGSFTGLRTACSVAQGLGFAASVPLLPVDSLLAVAEEARAQRPSCGGRFQVLAALDARMDEIYTGSYTFDGELWHTTHECQLVSPEQLQLPEGWTLAGNIESLYATRLAPPSNSSAIVAALPTAAALLRLAPQLLHAGLGVPAQQALPRYIRDKVAKTTDERIAEKSTLRPAV